MKNFYTNLLSKLKLKFTNNIFKTTTSKRNHSKSQNPIYYRQFFLFPIIFMPKLAFSEDEKESDKLDMKEIVKGEYENKIRAFASIEKRFLVFARVKKTGDYKMNYVQFLESLIPFNYIKTRSVEDMEKFLESNENFQKIIKYIDVNNDNFISFEEYICLSLLLSNPVKILKERFPDGKISKGEFTDFFMDELQKQNSMKITNQSFLDGRVVKTDELKLRQCIMDFFSKAFHNELKISIDKELKFLKHKIYYLLNMYEFYQIPQTSLNKISIENFAKVLVSYVNIYKAKILLRKIEEKKILLEGEVSNDEFFCFFWFLNNISEEKYEIFKGNKLSLEDLKKVFKEKIKLMPDIGFKINKSISDRQLKVLINLFDENGNR